VTPDLLKHATPTPNRYYIHTDHLDTPRVITDANQAVVWRWDNADPFGANVANQNPSGLGTFSFNLRFPGQYFDAETGYHYNYFRDYAPEIGRYVQADPIGISGLVTQRGKGRAAGLLSESSSTAPRGATTVFRSSLSANDVGDAKASLTTQGLNLFSYANSDPTRKVDPLGLTAEDLQLCFVQCPLINKIEHPIMTMCIYRCFGHQKYFYLYNPPLGACPAQYPQSPGV
jgi:RHS repeat-associated protein